MTKLFVYGVNSRCPKDLIEDEFSRCGKVTDIYITGKGNKVQYYFSDMKFNIINNLDFFIFFINYWYTTFLLLSTYFV